MARGDAESVEQLVRLPAAWNFPDREPVDGAAGASHGFGHCVANPAGRVMILDRDEVTARRTGGGDEPILVHRRNGIEIDHADRRCPPALSPSYAFSASKTVTPAPTTVATSFPLWRSTFKPPIEKTSSLRYVTGVCGRLVRM